MQIATPLALPPIERLQSLFFLLETGELFWRERPREEFATDELARRWNLDHARGEAATTPWRFGDAVELDGALIDARLIVLALFDPSTNLPALLETQIASIATFADLAADAMLADLLEAETQPPAEGITTRERRIAAANYHEGLLAGRLEAALAEPQSDDDARTRAALVALARERYSKGVLARLAVADAAPEGSA